jgi:hypothetical protein
MASHVSGTKVAPIPYFFLHVHVMHSHPCMINQYGEDSPRHPFVHMFHCILLLVNNSEEDEALTKVFEVSICRRLYRPVQ